MGDEVRKYQEATTVNMSSNIYIQNQIRGGVDIGTQAPMVYLPLFGRGSSSVYLSS